MYWSERHSSFVYAELALPLDVVQFNYSPKTIRLHKSEGHVPAEEKIIQKADGLAERLLSVIQEDSLVKFKAMIYLLSDFFTAEILKGTMDIKGMQRSL